MRCGPGHVSFEPIWRPELHGWKFHERPERLKDHKVGMFRWRKVIRKGLKKARRLLSGICCLQSKTIFRWMGKSLRYSIACVDQQPNNMQGLSVIACDANNACTVTERHRVKEAFSKGSGIKEMAFWWYFEAILNDSDVKFKIYYKYGNGQICSSMSLTDWVTLHSQPNSQPPRNRTYTFWNYFEARWETRLWISRYNCTEMHDLGKNVHFSRSCGLI